MRICSQTLKDDSAVDSAADEPDAHPLDSTPENDTEAEVTNEAQSGVEDGAAAAVTSTDDSVAAG